ncbi:MAG TPA: hypothetical protein PLS95_11350 [Thermoanaerobaculales bacterium]|nr:hypothetical protein [Thermoanaerobaculales bacterium]HQP44983.1 hypothetical protein [Thermoanaerobaculales bacterium]
MNRRLRGASALVLAIALVAAAGCEDNAISPVQREALDRAVAGYLGALAESYSTLRVEPLEEWASPIEVATVRRILKSLMTTGDRVEATLRDYQVDRVAVFRGINATVWTVEVWDLVRYDAYTGIEKGRTDSSVQQTMLQLRQVEGRWMVIARSIVKEEPPAAGSSGAGG